jgi:hypothetical protein
MPKLGFQYQPLPVAVRYLFNGQWDEGSVTDQLTVELPVGGLIKRIDSSRLFKLRTVRF